MFILSQKGIQYQILFVVTQSLEDNGLVTSIVWVTGLQLHNLPGLIHQTLHLPLVFKNSLSFILQRLIICYNFILKKKRHLVPTVLLIEGYIWSL